MFTLIGLGVARRVRLQRRRGARAPAFPAAFRGDDGAVPRLLRSGRGHRHADPARPGARAARAAARRARAIAKLLGLAPKTARRVARRRQRRRTCRSSTCRSAIGFACGPARRCRSTASCVEGTSTVDESMVTGEPMPVEKRAGRSRHRRDRSTAPARFVMRAEHVGAETLLARIVAHGRRGAAQPRADPATGGRRCPATSCRRSSSIAVVTFVVWALVGPEPRLAHALVNAVAVLIIACPCALGLATPMSIMVGDRARRAHRACSFRNAEAIELLRNGRHAGRRQDRHADRRQAAAGERQPRREDSTKRRVLRAGGERSNGAASIRWRRRSSRARRSAASRSPVAEDFASVTGQGRARRSSTAGTSRSATRRCWPSVGIDVGDLLAERRGAARRGQTVMFVAIDGRLAGLLGVADPIKPTTPEAIRALHAEGIRIVMLTGDSRATAQAVARQARDRRGHRRRAARRRSWRRGQASCRRQGASSRWPATASTTRRRWRRRTSASRWAPAPTSRWRARASRW